MSHISTHTPFGELTLFEEDGAIIAIEWGRAPDGRETPLLKKAVRQIGEYLDGRRDAFDLPLNPNGTDFQKKVWSALGRIPKGKTRTYGDVAKELKSGARAVGTACARNPIALVIPCHRVVAANGVIGNYTGAEGPETKRAILRFEGASTT
ncbi:MAG: methylated-DNA--[protein]-cysteine S-methyltransferase [Rhodospirillales bacterium]|nr:methylated-DNA--[protein]-cysteine S-methyltransferase [Rhodospirillales bacterium]MCW8951320.1 methylated-DNA--[protein]-cysteine S-methyltransferase [Rhodospirillales bacterium]MCW8971637.1 methylated-DNA--[protein]-cysteine S-methyltransferase [Rhodospirillales bacterium]MCW9003232.1 methylated-DNA--[protein]-cysteine S-methyltransferase [Rhodospirillales bacterium]MCW9039280.1 methylated-DNA--[protein]-cysteine S-methyltransferase [Rhodospirillales bacterium]